MDENRKNRVINAIGIVQNINGQSINTNSLKNTSCKKYTLVRSKNVIIPMTDESSHPETLDESSSTSYIWWYGEHYIPTRNLYDKSWYNLMESNIDHQDKRFWKDLRKRATIYTVNKDGTVCKKT